MIELADSISVVICAYSGERWPELLAAVASLQEQTIRPREVILVIDHNPQLLARARHELPDVTVIENLYTRGLSGARNSGIAAARGEIIAFIDDDATAAPDWLAWLIKHYGDPRVWGVGGVITPIWLNERPRWFPPEFDWVVGCSYRGLPKTTAQVRNLIGCNMSFRHEVFQKIGGFRTEVGRIGDRPIGCEETELCIRLQQQQPQVHLLYEPHSKVFHHIPKARTQWRYFLSRCYSEGLSKAMVAQYVGAGAGLAAEWVYARHTLPEGFRRGLNDALRGHDFSGLKRALNIVIGFSMTAAGYLRGRLALRLSPARSGSGPVNLSSEQL
jgi:GT2 family glycosyltransferase